MKFLKMMLGAAFTITAMQISAQEVSSVENDKMEETTLITIPTTNKDLTYRMKIVEQKEYPFAFEKEDKGKIDQDRVILPPYITRTIYIDNDKDKYYDKKMVVRVLKSYEDKIEIIPTQKGFDLNIDDKPMGKDISRSGYYLTDEDDNDYFVIEEYSSI